MYMPTKWELGLLGNIRRCRLVAIFEKKRVPSPSEIRSSQDFSLWESVAFPPETCKIAIITQRRFQKNEAYNPLFMVV